VVNSAIVVLDIGEDMIDILIDELGILKRRIAFSRIGIGSVDSCKDVYKWLFDS
jgi:hypothetical protein